MTSPMAAGPDPAHGGLCRDRRIGADQPRQPAPDDPGHIQAPRFPVAAARDLLARTCELPGSKRELLVVLSEYRNALFAFTAEADNH